MYLDSQGREHTIETKLVIIAAHAIETPRLLLLSANPSFPQGLANSSGMVGKNLMSHPTWQVFGIFDEPIHAHRGMQMGHVMVQDFVSQLATMARSVKLGHGLDPETKMGPLVSKSQQQRFTIRISGRCLD